MDDPRIRPRTREGALAAVQAEIVRERAAAYGRAVEKVRLAYEALAAAAPEAWDAAREAAMQARWELVVHREALGLTQQQDIDAEWPVPPKRR